MARVSAHESTEIELKLAFDPADLAKVYAHPVLAAAAPETRELISIYYDTGDDALRKAGVFLRVRLTGGRYLQTIKAAPSEAELIERREWEREIPGHQPDLGAAEGTALAPLLTSEVRAGLHARFHTRFWRRTFRIVRDAAEIEVAVDQGEITAGTRATPISEMELELKAGDKGEMFGLARLLAETIPHTLAVKTKAERGFELLEDRDHGVEKAGDVEVPPGMTSEDAFRAIARSCLRQIVANQPAVGEGRSEALHQMRIGLRRMRAAIALFAGMIAGPELDRIKGELRWVTRELGPARDLDVFGADVLAPLKAVHPDDEGVAAADREFQDKREAAYARAAAAVGSDRCRKVLLDLAAWVETGAWSTADGAKTRARPIAEHAIKYLSRLRRKIRKTGADMRDLDVKARHKLRIRAKRLRYATEFFATTFSGKKSQRRCEKSLSALKDLQDALGVLNDLAMRHALLADGGVGNQLHALVDTGVDEDKQLAAAEDAFARFDKAKAFWKG